jgi:serine/threonine-protein kinase
MPDRLQVLGGRYTAERKLGRAASGDVVYLARDTEDGRLVALRVMPAPFVNDALATRKFVQEAQRIVAVRHPNVAEVLIAQHERSRVSFVSEYVTGETVAAVLEAHRAHGVRFPLFRALTVLRVVAAGLDAIHAAGLAHGNVTPHNIVVERATGRPVLMDFGVAWTMREHDARSPEADLHGLASTAFELLTGNKPAIDVRLAPLVERVLGPVLARTVRHPRPSCSALVADLEAALGDFVLDTRTVPPPRAPLADAPEEVIAILVIDSAVERGMNIARAIERVFLPRVAHVRVASSAGSAIELAREQRPHVVALDLEMPGLGSVEILSRLRELDGSGESLVVGICSEDPLARWRYGALGVSRFVERSLRPSFLAQMVADVLAGGAGTVRPPASDGVLPIALPAPEFIDAEADTAPDHESRAPKSARRVLMVEDDHDILDAMRVALGAEYDLTTVDNGALALALLSSRRFDVIVLDLFMPGIDGAAVLRALRARRIATPVVLASASPDVASTAREFGTAGYLRKPFSLSDLEARLESAVYPGLSLQ